MREPVVPPCTHCDACIEPAVKVLNHHTSMHCANWFLGYYCDDCFRTVEDYMKREQEHVRKVMGGIGVGRDEDRIKMFE